VARSGESKEANSQGNVANGSLPLSLYLFASSTTTCRRMGDCRYSSTHSHPRHCVEVSGQLHAPGKQPRALSGRESVWCPEPVRTRRRREKSLAPTESRNPAHFHCYCILSVFLNLFLSPSCLVSLRFALFARRRRSTSRRVS
jgi:hypothetical protein